MTSKEESMKVLRNPCRIHNNFQINLDNLQLLILLVLKWTLKRVIEVDNFLNSNKFLREVLILLFSTIQTQVILSSLFI